MHEKMVEFIKRKSNARFVRGKDVRTVNRLSDVGVRERISELVYRISDGELRESVRSLINSHEDAFYSSVSSTGFHHAYPQGNAEHTLEVARVSFHLKIAYNAETNVKIIDDDILIAGALLHDIGKIHCYEIKKDSIETTEIGYSQAHVIHGIKLVSEHVKTKHLDDIIHIIASHNNLREWGSPVFPQTVEAWIVHVADMLSAKTMG